MKKYALPVLILVIMIMAPGPAMSRIRCGNDLINIGDSGSDVKLKMGKCEGQILDLQVIETRTAGRVYQETNTQATVYTTSISDERWHIRIKESAYNYCYNLIFVRGRLDKIEGWERCD